MSVPSPRARIEQALDEPEPAEALLRLATALKAEGMSQQSMYTLFTESQLDHERDVDETKYDAILQTLDIIGGWCVPRLRLFDTELPT